MTQSEGRIVRQRLKRPELVAMAQARFGDMVKAVVDVSRGVMAPNVRPRTMRKATQFFGLIAGTILLLLVLRWTGLLVFSARQITSIGRPPLRLRTASTIASLSWPSTSTASQPKASAFSRSG